MNTSQPQDSLRKKLKKLKKKNGQKLKKNEARVETRLLPEPPPRPYELNIRPPQSKNCSMVPVKPPFCLYNNDLLLTIFQNFP